MALLWIGLAIVVSLAPLGWASVYVSGNWDFRLQLLPTLRVDESGLTLTLTLAGLEIESDSTFSHDGLRFQSFDLSGDLGRLDLCGRISFHAQETRYRKARASVESQVGAGTVGLSLDHWSASGEYTSSDRDKFGPWPCLNTVSWDEAWRYIGRTLYVQGPVVGYERASYLKLYVGRDHPDLERFEVYVSSSNVPKFEAVFGPRFWEGLVGKTICVQGMVQGFRRTSGGPRNEGYSAAKVAVSSSSGLSARGCCGYPAGLSCPGTVIRWYEAHRHAGETMWIQGPVVSITGPATYHGYSGHFRVRIGGGGTVNNRVEVIMPTRPGWSTVGTSYSREVCVVGMVTVIGGVAVVLPPDLITTRDGPCCEAGLLPGHFLNHRVRFTWAPVTVTVDFGDCGTGATFRRLATEIGGLPFLCCGLLLSASLAFTKCRGAEELSVSTQGLRVAGLTFDLDLRFTLDSKTVSIQPAWGGGTGCVTLYGNILWDGTTLGGFAIYGWGISCTFDRVRLRLVKAIDPDEVEDMTDVTFYKDEFEYLGVSYTGEGCCGGTVTASTELWFGTKGRLFGLQRVRLELEVPLTAAATALAKGQWNFAKASPLEWFDVGWSVSF
ncbi:TPA: hypothetical protein DCY67_00625 [Candidatus Acetothermia bacterium]|nr:hypothetical protein [Candidatus Acetothermia bacterium]